MTLHMSAPLILLPLLLASCSAPARTTADPVMGSIERIDTRINDLIPADAALERLAEGFEWSEGPVWRRDRGYLLFSDIPKNTIYRWDDDEGLSVFLRPAGYSGSDPAGAELGANGLVIDPEGRLVMCDHGNRAIMRLDESDYTKTILADRYEGRRLNSPNDAVYRSNGDLYFTDPPYGLRGLNESPDKELPFNGVYRLTPNGELFLLTDELSFPNGIGFSPDERTLYVANSDRNRLILMAYEVRDDGGIENGRVFFDASELAEQGRRGAPDGLAVDQYGNLFATGPGGVLVLNPEGEHLGTIETGQATANCAFGDDGSTLYITADMYLARIRLSTKGMGF